MSSTSDPRGWGSGTSDSIFEYGFNTILLLSLDISVEIIHGILDLFRLGVWVPTKVINKGLHAYETRMAWMAESPTSAYSLLAMAGLRVVKDTRRQQLS